MSLLSVTVKKARYVGIQAQQYNSYVTLKLQNVKSTTVTVKGPNPCWEQDFLFETNDVNAGLLIEVWSKGMIWDRALGYNYIPLRKIQYSNEEGNGEWVSLDAELVMRDGEVVATKNPTGDSLLVDCRFELPFGRYDPPSGWKTLLAPECERRSGPRSVGDEDNTDWLPLGRKNPNDEWSGGDAENTAGDALQRKLERLNSTIMGHDEQSRRQHQFHGHSGYSEDSDYTSDLNYPIGQHPNSSASQFKSAAQLICTPQRSLETSRENSYERDDGPVHLQGSHHLSPNQQGRGYGSQHGYRYNETDAEPLYYNSRPRDYKEYSRRRKNWDTEDSQGWYGDQYTGYGHNYSRANDSGSRKRGVGERRPSLERQNTLYDDQYYSEQQYYDGTDKQQYQIYNAQNYGDYYNQVYDYQKSYGEEEEDRQWDSGGYYYPDNYGDNYQNHINKKRSSKKLPSTGYSNASQEEAYYTPQRSMSYEDGSIDNSRPISAAAARRKLLKQQRQSSDNYGPSNSWQSTEKSSNWQSTEEYNYYDDYPQQANTSSVAPPTQQVHKKRALPQIRAPSRSKSSAVSLPPTPVRQLPNHISAANRQRTSAPVSRTASTEYEQSDMYINETYNENYNYAYISNDNLPDDKFNNYQTEVRTSTNNQIFPTNYQNTDQISYTNADQLNYQNSEQLNYQNLEQLNYQNSEQQKYRNVEPLNYQNAEQLNYQNSEEYANDYDNRLDNYQEVTEQYPNSSENYQSGEDHFRNQTSDDYYYQNDYSQSTSSNYYQNESEKNITQKKTLARRANSPFVQQNTDSLESRDDELRDESFETAVDSICSSLPPQKLSTEYQSIDDYKQEPVKPPEPQQTTGVLGGLLGTVINKAQPTQPTQPQMSPQPQQQQQQSDRPRDQTNILTNQALAAMNVTKGFFSSITNAVNNTVQNINKQQKTSAQQQPQQQEVQRIQVTKRGSLKHEESLEKPNRTLQNSFDSQTQDYIIPEEPEYFEEKEEDDYYNKNYEKTDDYYDYNEKDYYENEEEQYSEEKTVERKHETNQKPEGGRRTNHLRHQDTIESEGKMNKRNYLRQQDSLDSCAEEIMMHNASANHVTDSTALDRYDVNDSQPDEHVTEIDQMRKHSLDHDNSLIEPYHPGVTGSQETAKGYSPSPPSIQKQQSIDLEGPDEPVPPAVPADEEEKPKAVSFEEEEVIQPTVQVVMPERRKMTAKERWHRAYNIVVQQLNVSHFHNFFFPPSPPCFFFVPVFRLQGLSYISIFGVMRANFLT